MSISRGLKNHLDEILCITFGLVETLDWRNHMKKENLAEWEVSKIFRVRGSGHVNIRDSDNAIRWATRDRHSMETGFHNSGGIWIIWYLWKPMSVSFNRVLRATNEAAETLAMQEIVISEREYFVVLNRFFSFFVKKGACLCGNGKWFLDLPLQTNTTLFLCGLHTIYSLLIQFHFRSKKNTQQIFPEIRTFF